MAQAAEDGPSLVWSAGFTCPPKELRADPKHNLHVATHTTGANCEVREAPMTVGIILAGKGREVVTIEPGASSR